LLESTYSVIEHRELGHLKIDDALLGGKRLQVSALNWAENGYKTLDLSKNGIDDASFLKILELIEKNEGVKKIKRLKLGHNPKISKLGYEKLGAMITEGRFKNLEELDLQGNLMGDNAASIIIDALLAQRKLKLLDLSQNRISDRLSMRIADMLVVLKSLENLFLKWNHLSKGVKHISAALLENTTL